MPEVHKLVKNMVLQYTKLRRPKMEYSEFAIITFLGGREVSFTLRSMSFSSFILKNQILERF